MIVAPSAAPVNIHTEAQNSTQIKVLWDPPPPETHNGDLSGYKVFFFTIFIIEILLKVALNTKTLSSPIFIRNRYHSCFDADKSHFMTIFMYIVCKKRIKCTYSRVRLKRSPGDSRS